MATKVRQRQQQQQQSAKKRLDTDKISTSSSNKLCHWDDLPHWQKDNKFILTGYVRETSSIRKSLHSLIYIHNETGNIYTHLLPSMVFMVVAFVALEWIVPIYQTTTWKDEIAFFVFYLGCMTCLGLSSTFHTLKSHSDRIANFGNKLDYLGIVVLIDASMVSMIYYGMHGHSHLQYGLWGLITFFGFVCAVVSLSDTFRQPEWRTFRASMFVAYGLSGVLPVLVGCYVFGMDEAFKRCSMFWIVLEGVLYISGAALYAARIPERFNPGKFDYWGHSHQLFHLLVVVAALSHAKGLVEAYKYIHNYNYL